MIPWYFKLLKITHFVEPCVHVADSWSRIASAFDHHVDVERLLDDEKSQVLAAKMNKIKYRNRFENIFPIYILKIIFQVQVMLQNNQGSFWVWSLGSLYASHILDLKWTLREFIWLIFFHLYNFYLNRTMALGIVPHIRKANKWFLRIVSQTY